MYKNINELKETFNIALLNRIDNIIVFEQLNKEEKIEIFEIVDKTIKILRENNICDRFDVVFEEKENRHFHIWIMPRHKWMSDLVGDIIDNIGKIFEYS